MNARQRSAFSDLPTDQETLLRYYTLTVSTSNPAAGRTTTLALLFSIDWLLDADMLRRAQIGLNKGEAHHALKNALRIGRQGEIRGCTAEGQHTTAWQKENTVQTASFVYLVARMCTYPAHRRVQVTKTAPLDP